MGFIRLFDDLEGYTGLPRLRLRSRVSGCRTKAYGNERCRFRVVGIRDYKGLGFGA